MGDMFKEVSSSEEAAILAQAERKKKGPDFSIRTATHWFTLSTHMGFCTVPSHYDNVPDTDKTGEPYDKYPTRMVITNSPYEVCRWCFLVEADEAARLGNLPPTEPEKL